MGTSALSGVQALTFDLYGTLVDVQASVGPALSDFLARRGSDADVRRLLVAWFSRRSRGILLDAILDVTHTPFTELNRRALVDVLEEASVPFEPGDLGGLVDAWNNTRPFPEVPAALARIKERYRIALLTNVDRDLLERVSAPIGVSFDALLSSGDAGTYKPSRKVFLHAAAALGLESMQILHVGTGTDIPGARAAGMRAALVNRGGGRIEREPFEPDLVVRDFSELADAIC